MMYAFGRHLQSMLFLISSFKTHTLLYLIVHFAKIYDLLCLFFLSLY